MKKSKIALYNILRAIAIICVIFAHMDSYTNLKFFAINSDYFARIGLFTFFFISGFLFQYSSKINSKADFILSIKKKVERIYPLFWLSILLTIALDKFSLNIHPVEMKTSDFIISSLGLEGLFPMFKVPYALWFVGTLLIYYMISYILICYARDIKQIVIYSTFIFLVLFLVHHMFGLIDINVFFYYYVYIIGFIIGFISISKNVSNEQIKSISITCLFSIYGLYLIYRLTCSRMNMFFINIDGAIDVSAIKNAINSDIFKFALMYDFIILFVIVSVGIIIYKKGSFTPNLDRFISNDIFLNISYSSYAVYLFHIQILSLIKKTLDMILSNGLIKDYFMLIAGIPILFMLGYQIQKYYDKIIL